MKTETISRGPDLPDAGRRTDSESSLLADACLLVLEQIQILPRRMLLETPGVRATVPMLRGVWGAALHDLDLPLYHVVFEGKDQSNPRPPGYLIRPAPADPEYAPGIEWLLIGHAIDHDPLLCRAWDVACHRGVGHARTMFRICDSITLGPSGETTDPDSSWSLADGARSAHDLLTRPCQLLFPAPLRLRRHGRLIEQPALPDIVVAAARRIGAFVPSCYQSFWKTLARQLLDVARNVQSGDWRGERLDLIRYSGRQSRDLDLHGVTGYLELPAGANNLWPLLAACTWLHLGKGTVMGLGQLVIV